MGSRSKLVFGSLVGTAFASGKLALTWEDCGDASTHGHTDDVQPTEIVWAGQCHHWDWFHGQGDFIRVFHLESDCKPGHQGDAHRGNWLKLASALPATLAQADVSMTAVDQDGE